MDRNPPNRLKLVIRTLLLVGMPLAFSLLVENFASLPNLYAIMQAFAFLGLVALGLSLTMIVGEFDLSVAAAATVAGLITVKVGGSSAAVGIAAAVVAGAAIGFGNAVLLPWLQVSSLVTTVGSMIFLSGVGFWLAGGRVLSYENFDVSDFLDQKLIGFLSPRSLVTIACYVVVAAALRFTSLGRDIYAAGGHRKAALQSGANVSGALLACFMTSGAFAALAGSLISLSLATASATLSGDVLLQAASAAIVGGVALSGGVGSPLGVAAGVMILTVLNNGLGLLNATSTQILLVNGLILLAVVLLDGRLGVAAAQLRLRIRPSGPTNVVRTR